MLKKARPLFLLLAAFLYGMTAQAQQRDTLYLKNGQVLTGNIKNVNLGVMSIDDVDLNLLKVKQNKIKAIHTSGHFKIETTGKEIYYGYIGTSAEGKLQIWISDTQHVDLQLEDINSMLPLEQKFLDRLDGSMTAGFSFSKSTDIGQLNLSAQVNYVTRYFQNQLSLSTIGSVDSSHFSRDNESAELFSDFAVGTRWFLAGLLGYQRNLELSIQSRLQEMLGVGNKLVVRNNLQLLGISGIILNQEKSLEGDYNGSLVEVPLMFRLDFFKFKSPNLQISTTQTAYIGITQLGRIRYNGNTSISYELVHDFSITLNFYTNYDSRPPSVTAGNIDYGLVIGLTYKF